jgi:hypothetical protein
MIDLVSSGRLATLAASLVFLVFAVVLWMRSRFNTQADFTTLMIPTLIHPIPAHGSGGEAAAGAH